MIKKFHFANPDKDNIEEFAGRIFRFNAILCFDLEDIVRKVLENNLENKLHREKVKQSIESLIHSSIKLEIGIRPNIFGSKEFYDDLELLEDLKNMVEMMYIFLPKIKSGEEVQECVELFKKRKLVISEIIPIIESKNAFNDLEKIISTSRNFINKIAFGHCDYNYDNGFFPFYHQDTKEYWKWVDFIVSRIELYNILFVNSPYLFLNDDKGFLNMINTLSNRTNGSFGQITLSLNQLKMCSLFDCKTLIKPLYIYKNKPEIAAEEKAKMLIKEYEDNITAGRSFAINKRRIMISPQEYLAAKIYLTKMGVLNVSEN